MFLNCRYKPNNCCLNNSSSCWPNHSGSSYCSSNSRPSTYSSSRPSTSSSWTSWSSRPTPTTSRPASCAPIKTQTTWSSHQTPLRWPRLPLRRQSHQIHRQLPRRAPPLSILQSTWMQRRRVIMTRPWPWRVLEVTLSWLVCCWRKDRILNIETKKVGRKCYDFIYTGLS